MLYVLAKREVKVFDMASKGKQKVCAAFKIVRKSALSTIFCLLCFSQGVQADWMRWELEWSFDGQLCQEYSYQKLLPSEAVLNFMNQ